MFYESLIEMRTVLLQALPVLKKESPDALRKTDRP